LGRIVITGGAGFIGSHLAERTLAEGHEVHVVDNLITGSLDNVAHLVADPRFTFERHDVSIPFTVEGPVAGIFHFASPASPEDYLRHPIPTLKVGSLGTHNALGLAKAKDAPIVIASTSEVYGDPKVHPQTEDYWGNVNPVGPRSCYDEAKRFSEALTMAYRKMHGVKTRIVRIFNTYGPRMRLEDGRVLPNFLCQSLRGDPITIYGDGSQTRSFCYVDDLVDGVWRLLFAPESPGIGHPVNIGNPEEMTIRQFAERLIAATGSTSRFVERPLPVDDPKVRCPDITRAKSVLGWSPKVPLEKGLVPTVRDFRARLGIEVTA
jgi:dTDP-glucose 4,6-dehydratase